MSEESMDEKDEALIDQALMAELNIEPYKKMSTSLLLVMHRQLLTLSAHTSVAVEDMDRAFIVENLANVKVSDQLREKIKKMQEKA